MASAFRLARRALRFALAAEPAMSSPLLAGRALQTPRETVVWTLDFSALGQPASPAAVLLDLTAGGAPVPAALQGPPQQSGALLSQTVAGAALVPGHLYRLCLTALVAGSILEGQVEIACVTA